MADGKHANTGVVVGSIVCLERFFKYSALLALGFHGNEGELEDEPIVEICEALGF